MKKSWIALLLAALTTASLALPASASSLPQPQAAAETRAQVEEYGSRPFREGLKPVLVDGVWMYMDQQSNIVDLNRGRFSYVYDFFDGLAAVIDKNTGKVGYIDKTGALRIPCQFGYHDLMGTVYVGYFKNGKATVLKEYYPAKEDLSGSFPTYSSGTWQVAHIDKTGEVLLTHHAELCLTLAIHVCYVYFVQLRIAKVNCVLLRELISTWWKRTPRALFRSTSLPTARSAPRARWPRA